MKKRKTSKWKNGRKPANYKAPEPWKRFVLYASEATITYPDGTVRMPKRSKDKF